MVKCARFIGFCMLALASVAHADKLRIGGGGEASGYPGYVETQGTVYPRQQVIYRFRTADRVFEINVSEGKRVIAGDSLFSLTNDRLITRLIDLQDRINAVHEAQNGITRLKMEISQKRKRLKHLKRRLQDERKVAEVVSGIANSNDLELLQDQILELQDELALLENQYRFVSQENNDPAKLLPDLRKNLDNLERQYELLTPTAPFDGIARRVMKANSPTQAGSIIMELWDESGYRIEASVTQSQLPYVKLHAKAEVFVDYYSEQKIVGEVIEVLPVASTQGKNDFPTFPVVVQLDKSEETIIPGMKVSLKIYGN